MGALQNQDMAKAELGRSGLNVLIPRCHREFTTRNLLVMEWAEGFKARLASHGRPRAHRPARKHACMPIAEARFAPQRKPLCAANLLSRIFGFDSDFHICSGH